MNHSNRHGSLPRRARGSRRCGGPGQSRWWLQGAKRPRRARQERWAWTASVPEEESEVRPRGVPSQRHRLRLSRGTVSLPSWPQSLSHGGSLTRTSRTRPGRHGPGAQKARRPRGHIAAAHGEPDSERRRGLTRPLRQAPGNTSLKSRVTGTVEWPGRLGSPSLTVDFECGPGRRDTHLTVRWSQAEA